MPTVRRFVKQLERSAQMQTDLTQDTMLKALAHRIAPRRNRKNRRWGRNLSLPSDGIIGRQQTPVAPQQASRTTARRCTGAVAMASSPPRAAGLTLPWTFQLKPAVGMPPRAILQKRAPIVLGPIQRVSPPLSKRHKLDGGFLLRNLSASKCLLCARNGLENQTSPPGSRWSVQIGSCQLFIWPASIPRSVGIHPMSLIT
ncbi:hypothetical protein Rleg_5806 (plasmid) [Rhizobium leguminosarum bv. trifolii WSM1325]|uniref:Uncharacterized protein n=1 Tax=Rhizobium leguminosarum bv. trifolii (strain WSM1325) TaxID=395491 RepID=C6B859_RHILS|nr:hypothetical protein Rleg_5806 [Rhizobium leguminosarum bv. trifolii WSM1325]